MITFDDLTLGQRQYVGPFLDRALIMARPTDVPEITGGPFAILMIIPKKGKRIDPERLRERLDQGWQVVVSYAHFKVGAQAKRP